MAPQEHAAPAAATMRVRRLRAFARAVAPVLLCAAVAASAAVPVAPQAGAAQVTAVVQGTAHDALYDIAFEGRRGIAVGSFGAILTTGDGGVTWTRQSPAPSALALFGAAMRSGRCVVVGQTGVAFWSEDCQHWKASASAARARLNAVSLNRNGRAWAVGAFGTVLSSSDWGATWTQAPIDWARLLGQSAEPHLYAVHVGDDGTVTLVGEFELVLRSSDHGAGWKVVHKGERSLFGLQVLGNGNAYAVGQNGAVLASSDKGISWRSLDTGVSAILTGIVATPDGLVVASGINTILTSRDAGASWQPVQSKLVKDAWHEAVALSEDSSGSRRVMSVGAAGTVLEIRQ
jgi:photosystem II stability/assembly factor-like uncharacterized protein